MLDPGVGYGNVDVNTHLTRRITRESGLLRAEGKLVHLGSRMATAEATGHRRGRKDRRPRHLNLPDHPREVIGTPNTPIGHPRRPARLGRARPRSRDRGRAPRLRSGRLRPLPGRARDGRRAPQPRADDVRSRSAAHDPERRTRQALRAADHRPRDRGDRHRGARRVRRRRRARRAQRPRRAADDGPRGNPPPRSRRAWPRNLAVRVLRQRARTSRSRRPTRLPLRDQADHVVVGQGSVGRAQRR